MSELRDELEASADALGQAIDVWKQNHYFPSQGVVETDPYRLLDANGRPILADMLAARGQVLAALAKLVAAEETLHYQLQVPSASIHRDYPKQRSGD